jgi:hypothetical protein
MGLGVRAGAVAFLIAVAAVGTAYARRFTLGPVPARVFAAVNHPTKLYSLKVRTLIRPKVSERAAVRDAVRDEPPVGPANGISLVRITKAGDPRAAGKAVWLVSFDVKHGTRSHGPVPNPHLTNYLVVAINPYNGRFVQADSGYDPKLKDR